MVTYLLVLAALLPGVGFSYAAGAWWRRWRWLRQHGQRVPGRVLGVQAQSTGRGGANFTTIGFRTVAGEPVEAELELGLPWQNWQVGETVDVYYDPTRPTRCTLGSRAEHWGYGVLVVVGWLVTGFMLYDVFHHL